MIFAPVDGLRLLAVETGLLIALTALAFLFVHFVHPSVRAPRWLQWILARNRRAVLLVIVVALVGRALLLPWVGVPQPRINDEFSYLLMGDTFSHFRLTNPTPAAWQHFETFHVNLLPTYHSKYPVAQGLALAVGEIIFREPWVGIYVSTALLCGAICWALQAFVPPGWALIGALLATLRLAFFSYWMNSYWGGSMAALGGAVALGAVVRLFDSPQSERRRALLSAVFGLALVLLATSRPFEGLAYALPLLAYFAYRLVRGLAGHQLRLTTTVLPVVIIGVAGLALMAHYNQQTTGNPLLMPYVLNERTYAELPLFFGQKTPARIAEHDAVFHRYYTAEAKEHGLAQAASLSGLIWLEVFRLGSNWFFYVGPALSFPVLIGLLSSIKRSRLRLVLFVTLSTGAAIALCTFSQAHYFAPATVAIYIFATAGLHHLWEQRSDGERAFVLAVCLTVIVTSLTRQTASAAINTKYALADNRELIVQQLSNKPGKHLVLVSYDLDHHYPGDELVHNGADLASQTILWARSKGSGNDSDLCANYGDRNFWSVTTDDVRFVLSPLHLCEANQR